MTDSRRTISRRDCLPGPGFACVGITERIGAADWWSSSSSSGSNIPASQHNIPIIRTVQVSPSAASPRGGDACMLAPGWGEGVFRQARGSAGGRLGV